MITQIEFGQRICSNAVLDKIMAIVNFANNPKVSSLISFSLAASPEEFGQTYKVMACVG
jgi:hypothetical protein